MTPLVVATKNPKPEPFVLYATRFARECCLEQLCSSGHPTLMVERQLVAAARKSLHEHLLANGWNRDEVERKIRRCAIEKVMAIIDDVAMQKLVAAIIQSKSLDDVFPDVN